MKRFYQSFVIAFSMYSKIPMPEAEWKEENMKYTMCFFPLIGVVIGALLYGWGCLSQDFVKGELLRAVLCVLIPVFVTGGIHLDGLLDTADALSSYQPRERKLEILKDSHAGAFAIIVAVCYFLLALGIWAELPLGAFPVLCVGFVFSRSLSALAVVTFQNARGSGSLATFSTAAEKKRVVAVLMVYLAVCMLLMVSLHPICGGAAVLGGWLTFLYYYRMSKKQFGGITGDLAGFFLQLSELVMAVFVWLSTCLFLL